ncbi:hypothetical protein [Microbacterium sp. SORGH_AS_0862]|uniref:hypothetical protein n=1 Tax=Microbacterium sp. SORGH_AS_0862 TaxID=3041789 RepID=UPI0027D83FE1|nr:hypothetical protein [Microbacterium sp. SORGH_AS_0862]
MTIETNSSDADRPTPTLVAKAVAARTDHTPEDTVDLLESTAASDAEARIAELQSLLDAERLETARIRIANDFGITPEDRDILLTGKDEEMLVMQARRMSELFGSAKPAARRPTRERQHRAIGSIFGSGPSW